MLFTGSMSLLWLSYYGVSLVVLIAVYFALSFLPRLPRLVITWCVAGAMWMPARFSLPLVEENEFYTGWAPAAFVSAVGFLEHNASALRGALLWLVFGIALGAAVGVALWWWRRPVERTPAKRPPEDRRPPGGEGRVSNERRAPAAKRRPGEPRRREPVIN
ncbi:hypothetical protein [Vreelandella malpeensis]|uniref:Uncharacterized protein n=1 Tax=Vreelandella malpeensis TaxID=1172368 RepID=A0ABS8DR38_9GAMM|nr:hypothetical protein [Halomonas malpeensis]MCB8888555.1 hypothetical protein [Halomonas malpeensis]